jgi:tetratricopeptide (TPR) repeat protein
MKPQQKSTVMKSLAAQDLEGYILQPGQPPAAVRLVRVWGVEVVPGSQVSGLPASDHPASGAPSPGVQVPAGHASGLQAGEDHTLAAGPAPSAQIEDLQESLQMPSNNGHFHGAVEASQQPAAQVERVRQKFDKAQGYYQAKDYRKAIVMFERVRQMAGLPKDAYRACLFNIGLANIKLRRFATAILYFETYLQSSQITEKDRKLVQRLLEKAKRGAGVIG